MIQITNCHSTAIESQNRSSILSAFGFMTFYPFQKKVSQKTFPKTHIVLHCIVWTGSGFAFSDSYKLTHKTGFRNNATYPRSLLYTRQWLLSLLYAIVFLCVCFGIIRKKHWFCYTLTTWILADDVWSMITRMTFLLFPIRIFYQSPPLKTRWISYI